MNRRTEVKMAASSLNVELNQTRRIEKGIYRGEDEGRWSSSEDDSS